MLRVRLFLAAVVVVAACGGDGDDDPQATEIAGIPVLEGHTAGPGAELGDGFTVADGSVLLGDPVPTGVAFEHRGEPIDDRGWRALLLVTGDAGEVLESYARQAAAVGLPLTSRYGEGRCVDDFTSVVTCDLRGQVGSDFDGRSIALELQRGTARSRHAPRSHLLMSYSETGEPPYRTSPVDVCPRCRDVVPPPAPTGWPPLPAVGERYESTGNRRAGLVEPGSHLVAHPASLAIAGTVALFVVTDDPEEVLDRYMAQQGADQVFEERRRDDGATVIRRSWRAGGGEYDADVVIRDGRPTYLLMEHYASD